MKKVVSILAVAVMSVGLFSCEVETSLEETDALFDTTLQTSAQWIDEGSTNEDGTRED